MDSTTIIGLVSAALTTGAYVPQAIKTWRTRRTGDLSLGMFFMIFLGTVGWLVYGLLKDDLPIILANTITLGTSFVILYFKVREVRAKRFHVVCSAAPDPKYARSTRILSRRSRAASARAKSVRACRDVTRRTTVMADAERTDNSGDRVSRGSSPSSG